MTASSLRSFNAFYYTKFYKNHKKVWKQKFGTPFMCKKCKKLNKFVKTVYILKLLLSTLF